jgi:hypothetical protein
MNAQLKKTLLTVAAAALQGAALAVPAPFSFVAQGLVGLFVGWAHLPVPGSK